MLIGGMGVFVRVVYIVTEVEYGNMLGYCLVDVGVDRDCYVYIKWVENRVNTSIINTRTSLCTPLV